MTTTEGTVCVFCGAALDHTWRMTVHLTDGFKFNCCPLACAPMVRAAEERRRELADAEAARHQIVLPLLAG
jgi:hypothetical protein